MDSQTFDATFDKSTVRKQAFAARKAAFAENSSSVACAELTRYLGSLPHANIIAGYMAIQTEVDPNAAMVALFEAGKRICVPVIQGPNMPLLFREWTPSSSMIEGDFGALIPRGGELLTPDVSITPLVAFDGNGHRLGYGGGFYDRSIAGLRSNTNFRAVGFAFAGQECEEIPTDQYDQTLDAIVTERGVREFS